MLPHVTDDSWSSIFAFLFRFYFLSHTLMCQFIRTLSNIYHTKFINNKFNIAKTRKEVYCQICQLCHINTLGKLGCRCIIKKHLYKLFYGNVQKTCSPSQYENAVWMSWKLCMQQKIWKFSIFIRFSNTKLILKSVHIIWSKLQHLMKSSNYVLELKTLNSTHHKYGHFYGIMSTDSQQCSTIAEHIITVTFWFGPYDLKSRYFLKGEASKTNEHHKNPLFQYICLFKTLFAIGVIGIKGVILASLYLFPKSE